METVIVCLIGYVLLLAIGIRRIRQKGRTSEAVWYSLIIGWCMYMSLAKWLNWRTGSITDFQYLIYAPLGQWLIQMLGGS